MKDPYKVLGVSPNATEDEVKTAYRNLAKKYHPDKYAGTDLADLATEKMQEINEAYDTICKSGFSSRNGYEQSGSYSQTNYYEIRQMIDFDSLDEAYRLLQNVGSYQRDAEWNFLMGRIFDKKGMLNEAVDYYRRACQLDPRNREYAAAYSRMNDNSMGGYRAGGSNGELCGSCDVCDMCSTLMCADCCCECMGGDLIPCI